MTTGEPPNRRSVYLHSKDAKAWILAIVDDVSRSFVGNDPDKLLLTMREALLNQAVHMLPATCRMEITEEDADMQIVREIHEEVYDVVRLKVNLDMPIRYLVLHVVDAHLRIQIGPV